MTELEILVGNLNRLTELLRFTWSNVANPPLGCREACNQIDQYSVELRRHLLLMGAELGLRDKR
jgi:hypothetical protein